MLEDLLARYASRPVADQRAAVEAARAVVGKPLWVPNPGPQTDAFFCRADELFYGGAAGGGKSSLLCGLAADAHDNSIIFRREYPQIKGLVDEVSRIVGTRDGYNSQDKLWRLPGDRVLELGAVSHEDDKEKYQGRAHDYAGFDEITHFSESQYRFLIGWVRSVTPGRRCRVVVAGNPPFSAEGQWVIKYWAPWLDPVYPDPAQPGELRWFIVVGDNDREVGGPGPHVIDGKSYLAKSRTFIPARLEDNPYLIDTGYAATIEGMPEPYRTMMREGRFDVGVKDDDRQVIPTRWIIDAQARWTPGGAKGLSMTAAALDIGAGCDETVLACRYGGWYAPLMTMTGDEARDEAHAAALVMRGRRDNCPIVIDVGGGFGGPAALLFKENGIQFGRINGADASKVKTRDGSLGFYNKRAEIWWKFREELDPNQQGGSAVALPPDPRLRADLASARWSMTTRGIQIEAKDDIKKRLGRSPDRGDAVVMALSEGARQAALAQNRAVGWTPRVITSRNR